MIYSYFYQLGCLLYILCESFQLCLPLSDRNPEVLHGHYSSNLFWTKFLKLWSIVNSLFLLLKKTSFVLYINPDSIFCTNMQICNFFVIRQTFHVSCFYTSFVYICISKTFCLKETNLSLPAHTVLVVSFKDQLMSVIYPCNKHWISHGPQRCCFVRARSDKLVW